MMLSLLVVAGLGAVSGQHGEEGTVASPNYPEHYGNDEDVTTDIKVHGGDLIAMTFTDIDIENSTDCGHDYVSIADSNGAVILGYFCGSAPPSVLVSQTSGVAVTFRSDSSVTHRGFSLAWVAISPLPAPSPSTAASQPDSLLNGTVTSPNYPDSYSPDTTVTIEKCVAEDSVIVMVFTDLDLEEPAASGKCHDWVSITDSSGSTLLPESCGTSTPTYPITTTTNCANVAFQSDHSISRGGFAIDWIAVPQDTTTTTTSTTESSTDTPTSLRSGVLTSPNHPDHYGAGVATEQNITVTPGHTVRIVFTHFNLEEAKGCSHDWLAIMEQDDMVLMDKTCYKSQLPEPVESLTNSVSVVFHSDQAGVTGQGYRLEWQEVDHQQQEKGIHGNRKSQHREYLCCTRSTSTLVSPNFPKNYGNNLKKSWLLEVPENHRITIQFLSFDIEDEGGWCPYDWVRVRDGDGEELQLTQNCGKTLPQTVTSRSNSVTVYFHSDGTVTGGGFELVWRVEEQAGTEVLDI